MKNLFCILLLLCLAVLHGWGMTSALFGNNIGSHHSNDYLYFINEGYMSMRLAKEFMRG